MHRRTIAVAWFALLFVVASAVWSLRSATPQAVADEHTVRTTGVAGNDVDRSPIIQMPNIQRQLMLHEV